MDWANTIRRCFESDRVLYSGHAKLEMETDEFGVVADSDVYEAICRGEAIKEYPDDAPYPSVLIFGTTSKGRPLHVVCAYNEEEDQVVIVTVYQPNPDRWVDYRRRRSE